MLLGEISDIRFKNRRSKPASESERSRRMFLEFSSLSSKVIQQKGTMILD